MSGFDQYRYVDTLPASDKLRRLLWELVWLLAFRPTPRWALHGWRRLLLRLFGARIGPGCRIAPSCRIWAPWKLEMGTLSVLADGVDCYTMDRIRIGSKVAVSQRTFLCTGSHDVTSLLRPLTTAPITIGDHAWIAAECFVHPGTSIGEGTVVGARSVVTRDLPPWSICVGNPCRFVRQRTLSDSPTGA
ncbi:putative colanic acid biosynthesis acetyltransferase [Pseudoxanthomonas suwonensis]|uniref:putative colanic acid biosynthesis acetyltransferase n=1 Tax=Pseudoxanthomonas suwonensis TaxID=314722 RepID=UPI00138F64FA|nr:putative colanic acid biosynthesis acetyltransferase [Pseudoxanthomonas suwonensis]KAF1700349.1 putative colanic acid biosynthesis acetyltransferase [Pseudoxanthomonas suwonensis]